MIGGEPNASARLITSSVKFDTDSIPTPDRKFRLNPPTFYYFLLRTPSLCTIVSLVSRQFHSLHLASCILQYFFHYGASGHTGPCLCRAGLSSPLMCVVRVILMDRSFPEPRGVADYSPLRDRMVRMD